MLESWPERVSEQIESVKLYLGEFCCSIEDGAELQTATPVGLHSIRTTRDGVPRLLRISYEWLEQRDADGIRETLTAWRVGEQLGEASVRMIIVDVPRGIEVTRQKGAE